MAKSTNIVKHKRAGRPVEIDADQFVGLRIPEAQLKRIDAWAAINKTQRSDAIRRLVDIGLNTQKRSRSKSK